LGVGHGRGQAAAEVDVNVRRVQVARLEAARTVDAQLVDADRERAFEQHDVGREDQLVFRMVDEPVQHLPTDREPGRQMR
jgi:hypothetical protein